MNKLHNSYGEWLTVKQVSHMTGKSIDAIRMLLYRKKLSNVKKVNRNNGGPNREHWLIHRDTAALLCNGHMTNEQTDVNHNNSITEDSELLHNVSHNIDVIPLHYHDQKQREWLTERDQLQAGLMMYRYKFEEMERQMRLLPAPPEVVASELEEKAAALETAENIIQQAQETQKKYEEALEQLKIKLQEEEHAKEAFRIQWELSQAELKRPWWQKIWKR